MFQFSRLREVNLASKKEDFRLRPRFKERSSSVELFMNPEWHKAVFYRDPLARFLSGWADKCNPEMKHNSYCMSLFGANYVPFSKAVEKVRSWDKEKLDDHFKSQTSHCGGLDKIIHTFTTIADLDAPDSRGAVRKMLVKFELSDDSFDEIYSNLDGHATGARHKLKEYYGEHPEFISTIVDFFFVDYETFNIVLPDFALDALVSLKDTNDPNKLSDKKLEKLMSIKNDVAANKTLHLDEGLSSVLKFSSSINGSPKEDTGLKIFKHSSGYVYMLHLFTLLILVIVARYSIKWYMRIKNRNKNA